MPNKTEKRRTAVVNVSQDNMAELRSILVTLRRSLQRIERAIGAAEIDGEPPPLPEPDADGTYPALETMRAILARKLIERRKLAGLTQAELAKRAGVRQETVSRLETGKQAPNVRTLDKVDRALQEAGA